MWNLGNFFFNKLPLYFKQEDTYKDNNNEGILERYLSIFGEDFDEVLLPMIADYTVIVDPLESYDVQASILDPGNADDEKFLNHIAYTLGNPPDLTGDDFYRKLLSIMVSLYKIKGTIPAYNIWLNIIGLQASVLVEVPPVELTYDSGFNYDSLITTEVTAEAGTYDTSCPTCSDYALVIEDISKGDLTPEQEKLIADIVRLNEPINAKLVGTFFRQNFVEVIPACMNETITLDFIEGGTYDGVSDYDEGLLYDTIKVISTEIINETCPLGPEFDTEEFDTNDFNV